MRESQVVMKGHRDTAAARDGRGEDGGDSPVRTEALKTVAGEEGLIRSSYDDGIDIEDCNGGEWEEEVVNFCLLAVADL